MPFDPDAYRAGLRRFPDITYAEFREIPDDDVRLDIARKNKVISTDTYNRTMSHVRGDRGRLPEAYTLTFRRAPDDGFLVACGIRRAVIDAVGEPITHGEIDFARDFYSEQSAKGGVGYFAEALWREVVDCHGGRLPLVVRGVADGTVLLPGEPVVSVEGPGELAAHLEPLLLRAFYETVVATDAVALVERVGEGRLVEAGKRAAISEEDHVRALRALALAGIRVTSNDTAALAVPEVVSGGTTAHRLFAAYDTELEAMEAAIAACDRVTLLVDLVEPYAGIEKVIALKKRHRGDGKAIFMRLDSGDLAAQAVHALSRLRAEGMEDPALDRISIADVSTPADIERIDAAVRGIGVDPRRFVSYVTGHLLVMRNKTRNAVSAAYKLTETAGRLTGKLAGGTGKGAIPGRLNVELRGAARVIVLEDEPPAGRRLLAPLYDRGTLLLAGDDRRGLADARRLLADTFPARLLPSHRSTAVEVAIRMVEERFLAQVSPPSP
jgi:putative nicotinate phosphoribosyltransferase